ncbi:Hypothetical predicted protein [Pelobates cultripes]|uniref:Uncharacterized protein n=1 Tax=Pelobates cultripes TaxID=61616 RepID=A0AAD1WDU9_PELCU|nr:Hypothetical predicted protein [Pelobates cultripes]
MVSGALNVVLDDYVLNFVDKLNGIYGDVSLSLPNPAGTTTHHFRPGDQVFVKSFFNSGTFDPPYGPSTTVAAITRTAVLTEENQTWIHAS